MRIAVIAKHHAALSCATSARAQERAGTFFCGGIRKSQKDKENEIHFVETYHRVCSAVHISVFCDERTERLRRRLLHHQRRTGSAWLRLSEHGDMPGRVRRGRRHVFAGCRIEHDQPEQRKCTDPVKAASAARGNQSKSTRLAVIGRSALSLAPHFAGRGAFLSATAEACRDSRPALADCNADRDASDAAHQKHTPKPNAP